MNKQINEIIKNVGKDVSGKWVSIDELDPLVDTVINECINVIKNTGSQCAFTTHDLAVINCTIDRSIKSLQDHFKK